MTDDHKQRILDALIAASAMSRRAVDQGDVDSRLDACKEMHAMLGRVLKEVRKRPPNTVLFGDPLHMSFNVVTISADGSVSDA